MKLKFCLVGQLSPHDIVNDTNLERGTVGINLASVS